MHHFENVYIIVVDELPWEIDGVKIYKKTSTMDFWWDETKDGRWWKVSDSSRSTLNGESYIKWRKEVYDKHRLLCVQ